jgi:hypothetical protein
LVIATSGRTAAVSVEPISSRESLITWDGMEANAWVRRRISPRFASVGRKEDDKVT